MDEGDLREIQTLSLRQDKSLLEKVVKTQEELGELANEVLIAMKSSGSHHKVAGVDGVLGESIDVILCALSIFFHQGGSLETFNHLMKIKTDKWKRVISPK
jgi:hypothetical protein